MNRQVASSLVLLLATTGLFAQAPTPVWSRQFTFGGTNDVPRGLQIEATGELIVNGWFSGPGGTRGAISKFSSNGTQQSWTVLDSVETNSVSNQLALLPQDNAVVWYAGNRFTYNPSWLIKLDETTHQELWRIPVNQLTFLGNYTADSLIAVSAGVNPIVFIYTRTGSVARQFPLGTEADNSITIRAQNGNLWIWAQYPGGVVASASYFVAKYDIASGQQIWRQNFIDVIQSSGELDRDGTAYIAGTKLVNDPRGLLKFMLAKITPDGFVVWQKEWFGRTNFEANYNNFTGMVTIVGSGSTARIVLAGTTQRGDSTHTVNTDAYAYAVNGTSGDSLWVITRSAGTFNGFTCARATSVENELVLVEEIYLSSSSGIVDQLHKYHVPPTSVRELGELPELFRLFQNYPNPFNPTTRIEYQIPNNEPVALKVFDILGREVETLVNEQQSPGTHHAEFDGINLTSGVYFYRLEAGSFLRQRKMLLVK